MPVEPNTDMNNSPVNRDMPPDSPKPNGIISSSNVEMVGLSSLFVYFSFEKEQAIKTEKTK